MKKVFAKSLLVAAMFSVALSLGSPPAAVSSYSVSVKPGLSSGSPCGLSRRRMFHSFSKRV